MKRIIILALNIILIAGVFVLLGFIRREHNSNPCRTIAIELVYQNEDTLITREDMISHIRRSGFGEPVGRVLQISDLARIKQILDKITYLENTDVDLMLNGTLRIRTRQRIPALKLMFENQTWYVDSQGIIMPPGTVYIPRLCVVSGNLTHTQYLKDGTNLRKLAATRPELREGSLHRAVNLALYVHQNPTLKRMVEQIYVNPQGELEVFTQLANQHVVFGDDSSMDHKFNNLLAFYRFGPNMKKLNQYKIINLKYNNQIVCSKKQAL